MIIPTFVQERGAGSCFDVRGRTRLRLVVALIGTGGKL